MTVAHERIYFFFLGTFKFIYQDLLQHNHSQYSGAMSYTRPDFVSNYYKTSTFSFLSTNKAKLQKKAADRIKLSTNEKDLNTNDHEGSSPDSPENQKFVAFSDNSNSVILHIDMVSITTKLYLYKCFLLIIIIIVQDCFYVSVSLKDQPHLWKLPVAVSPAGRQG